MSSSGITHALLDMEIKDAWWAGGTLTRPRCTCGHAGLWWVYEKYALWEQELHELSPSVDYTKEMRT